MSHWLLTHARQQQWSTRLKTDIDPVLASSPNNYGISDASFTQQLTASALDVSPGSDQSPLQNWANAGSTYPFPASTYQGNFSPAPYSNNASWPTLNASGQGIYASAQHANGFMTSELPRFEPIGLDPPILIYLTEDANQRQVFTTRSPWMTRST